MWTPWNNLPDYRSQGLIVKGSSEGKGIRSDPFKIKKRTIGTMTGQLKLGGRPANRNLSHPVVMVQIQLLFFFSSC